MGLWRSTLAAWRQDNGAVIAENVWAYFAVLSVASALVWLFFGATWAPAVICALLGLITILLVGNVSSYRKVGKRNYILSLLAERHKGETVFPVKVDYADSPLTFSTMMSGSWITRYLFEPITKGKKEVHIHLLAFPGVTTSEEAVQRIAEAGFRPADPRELVAFRRRHRYANHDHHIVFLGAVYVPSGEGGIPGTNLLFGDNVSGLARVAYIPWRYFGKEEPFSTTYFHYRKWFPGSVLWHPEYTRFAAVKIN